MKTLPRPDILAVRAVNQYRRRDVLTYLALRYYLANRAARRGAWIREVCSDLVMTRSAPPYFKAPHFKEIDSRKLVKHRQLYLPCANEALAEATLLWSCAREKRALANPGCVYSYHLSDDDDSTEMFQHYFVGLRKRQDAIARACRDMEPGVVQYTDIRKFYPTISIESALQAWRRKASATELDPAMVALGEKLLLDHRAAQPAGGGLLTGPMLSHVVANLALLSRSWPT